MMSTCWGRETLLGRCPGYRAAAARPESGQVFGPVFLDEWPGPVRPDASVSLLAQARALGFTTDFAAPVAAAVENGKD